MNITRVNVIHNKSCLEMVEVPGNSVHFAFTSPPYNLNIEYGEHDDGMSEWDYWEFTVAWMTEIYRVLVPGGRLGVNVANTTGVPYHRLTKLIVEIAEDLEFLDRGEVIWDKGDFIAYKRGLRGWRDARNPGLRECHEYILFFSKQIRELDCEGFPVPGDDLSTKARDTVATWRIAPESHSRHPAPFPVELPRRAIRMFTRPGMIVLDPFMGSGTTAVACLTLPEPRRFIGYELNPDFIGMAMARIKRVKGPKLTKYFKELI